MRSFTKYQIAQFYKYMTEFKRDYYGMDPLVSGSAIHPLAYKELTPLFVFNVSKQSERLNHVELLISLWKCSFPRMVQRIQKLMLSL